MGRFSTVVFDVGGTLLRLDHELLTSAYLEAAAARGIVLNGEETRRILQVLELELPTRAPQRSISLEPDYGRAFWDEFYQDGFRRCGVTVDMSSEAAQIRERFQRAEFESLFPDVIPALDDLSARGVKMGVLSNYSPNCEDVLRQSDVHRYFDFFVVSAVVGIEKPDPRIFELVVQAAGRPRSEIVYVGDSVFHDTEGARGAGISAILVDRADRYPNFSGTRIRDLRELPRYIE